MDPGRCVRAGRIWDQPGEDGGTVRDNIEQGQRLGQHGVVSGDAGDPQPSSECCFEPDGDGVHGGTTRFIQAGAAGYRDGFRAWR